MRTSLSQLFHQGCFPPTSFNELGLDSQWYDAMGYQFKERAHMSCYSYGHSVNYMKGGLMCADRIITVRIPNTALNHCIRTAPPG